jgi:hypothetical protein
MADNAEKKLLKTLLTKQLTSYSTQIAKLDPACYTRLAAALAACGPDAMLSGGLSMQGLCANLNYSIESKCTGAVGKIAHGAQSCF